MGRTRIGQVVVAALGLGAAIVLGLVFAGTLPGAAAGWATIAAAVAVAVSASDGDRTTCHPRLWRRSPR